MNAISPAARLGEIARFGFVGGIATLTHLAVAGVVFWMVPQRLFLANTFGFTVAFLVSYLGHHRLTFRSTSRHGQSVPRFALVAFAGFLINTAALWLFTLAVGYQTLIGIVFSTAVAAAAVYLLARRWAFMR